MFLPSKFGLPGPFRLAIIYYIDGSVNQNACVSSRQTIRVESIEILHQRYWAAVTRAKNARVADVTAAQTEGSRSHEHAPVESIPASVNDLPICSLPPLTTNPLSAYLPAA